MRKLTLSMTKQYLRTKMLTYYWSSTLQRFDHILWRKSWKL